MTYLAGKLGILQVLIVLGRYKYQSRASLPCFPIYHSGFDTVFLHQFGFCKYDSVSLFGSATDRHSLAFKGRVQHHFFLENEAVQQADSSEKLCSVLKECDGFNMDSFMKLMVSRIPTYHGFDDADAFMGSMLNHIEELTIETIKEIMRIYRGNSQCVNRARNSSDVEAVKKHLDSRSEENDNPTYSETEETN